MLLQVWTQPQDFWLLIHLAPRSESSDCCTGAVTCCYGRLLITESDQGTHFTGVFVQQLALDLQIDWKFHVAYYPQAAGMMGRYNVVLKQGL